MSQVSFAALSAVAVSILLVQAQLIHAAREMKKAHHHVPALFAFGDSIIDAGNNNKLPTIVRSNFPPYGQDFVGHKPTGRFCNGRIMTDFLASSLGVKELLPAYFQAGRRDLPTGVSFASGGSGFDELTAKLRLVITMPGQLEMFKDYRKKLRKMVGKKKAAKIVSESLYVVVAGSNDVALYFSNPLRRFEYNISTYADFLMRCASDFTKELRNLGARKIAVWGVPPVGCVPCQRTLWGGPSRACALDNNQLAQLYNSKLSKELHRLDSIIKGAKITYIDIYHDLLDIMQHPKKYGFRDTTNGCCVENSKLPFFCNQLSTPCKDVSSYLFWDCYHTTERANKIIFDHILAKYIRLLT